MVNLVVKVLGLLAVAEGSAVVGWLALLAGLRKERPKRPLKALVAGLFVAAVGVGVLRPSPTSAGGLEAAIAIGMVSGAFGADVVPMVGKAVLVVARHLTERAERFVQDGDDGEKRLDG